MTDLNSVTERQRLILTSFSLSKVFIWELLLCHSDILSQFSAILSLTCRRVGGKIHFHFQVNMQTPYKSIQCQGKALEDKNKFT